MNSLRLLGGTVTDLLEYSANDATLKRTVAPSDVFNALTELEFDSFRGRLEKELEAFTEVKAGKRKAKKSEINGAPGDEGAGADSSTAGARGEDEDVEMLDHPTKRVKRDSEGREVSGEGAGDGDETQEEEIEEDEEEPEEDEQEDEGEEEAGHGEEDIDRVEDLDQAPRPMDPDAEETDDDDGPGSQLRDGLGLG